MTVISVDQSISLGLDDYTDQAFALSFLSLPPFWLHVRLVFLELHEHWLNLLRLFDSP